MRLSRSCSRVLVLSLILCALLATAFSGGVPAQTAPAEHEKTLTKMFDAIQSRSYDKFIADGESWFQKNFTAKMFDDLAKQLGPKLKQGYSLAFLTSLNRQDHVGYVWKLSIKGGKEDYLATLFIKNRQVSGFIVR